MVKLICGTVWFVVALGCGSGGSTQTDAASDAVVINGTHYHYVINKIRVAQNSTQAMQYGLDVGSSTSNVPDGTVDNKLSMALGTLSGMGVDSQGASDRSVVNGGFLLLADLQAQDFTTASGAGFRTLVGDNPMPTPPGHLTGGGSFGVAPSSPSNSPLVGSITTGTLTAGTGNLVVQLALGEINGVDHVVQLNLVSARVQATNMRDAKIGDMISGGAIIAGAVTQTDIDTQFLPALGAVLQLPVDSLKTYSLFQQLIAPDVCTTGSCTAPDGLSFGVEVTAVPGAFAP